MCVLILVVFTESICECRRGCSRRDRVSFCLLFDEIETERRRPRCGHTLDTADRVTWATSDPRSRPTRSESARLPRE